MDSITWPFEAFLSLCAGIAGWFADQGSTGFYLLQLATALILIASTVLVLVYGGQLLAALRRSR